jgi:hypothetical protein
MDNRETPMLRVVTGTNPAAVTRAYFKARTGDQDALRWLMDQHRAGNSAATKAISDLERLMPTETTAFVA